MMNKNSKIILGVLMILVGSIVLLDRGYKTHYELNENKIKVSRELGKWREVMGIWFNRIELTEAEKNKLVFQGSGFSLYSYSPSYSVPEMLGSEIWTTPDCTIMYRRYFIHIPNEGTRTAWILERDETPRELGISIGTSSNIFQFSGCVTVCDRCIDEVATHFFWRSIESVQFHKYFEHTHWAKLDDNIQSRIEIIGLCDFCLDVLDAQISGDTEADIE